MKSGNGDGDNPIISTTYQGTVLEYKNVKFDKEATKLSICVAAPNDHAGKTMNVHLGSAESTPVGVINMPTTGDWNVYTEAETTLSQAIPAGEHDIYLTFTGGGTCNFYWFGLN